MGKDENNGKSKYFMLHRKRREISDAAQDSEEKDVNKDKWIGVGGHFEHGESPEECLLQR